MKKFVKYNLSRIMSNAWKAFRALSSKGKTFAFCLRAAWKYEKTHAFSVKRWFMDKNFAFDEVQAISLFDSIRIVRETEKAVLVEWFGCKYPMNRITKWVLKSCIEF